MSLANPAALWLSTLVVPIVLLHVLRPRRLRQTVPSTYLWRTVAVPTSAASPWQRLRPSVLLFLQLLAVMLLAVAAARPVVAEPTALAQHTVFIVDASASMGARDGEPLRIDRARELAGELHDELPDGGLASVVEAGPRATVLLSGSADDAAFDEAIAAVDAGEGSADWDGAFALAQSLATADVPIGFVLLSDGGLDDAALRQVPPATRYVGVGEGSTNRAVTSLVVEARGSGLHVIATVANTGGAAADQVVRLDVDGRTEATETVRVGPGEVAEVSAELPPGTRVEAFLEGEDLLDIDDHAYAVAPRTRTLRVLVAGPGDPFLDALLASVGDVEVVRSEISVPGTGVDLAIYDRVAVPLDPGVPFLAIAPPGGVPGVEVTGSVERPAVTLVDTRDPLLSGVDLTGVAIAEAQAVNAPLTTTLVGAEGAPLLVRGETAGRPFLYQSFANGDSNLPLQLAFPILGDRVLAELGGSAAAPLGLTVGDRLPLDVAAGGTVTRPGGATVERPPGAAAPTADRAGFWAVEAGDASTTYAVNPPVAESTLTPVEGLAVPETDLRPRGEGVTATAGQRSVLVWVVVPLVGVLAAEWLLSRRRIGVSHRQWRAATLVRAGVAVLVVLALADLAVVRPAERVATMFVVDASDSLGAGGQAEAVAWVRDALAAQPADGLAGVTLFGGDARLEATLREDLALDRPTVRVDPTRTDLAAAMRLGGAVLPTDARRRIVVVSDGRPTEGDAAAEAERLAAAGIAVEFHAVGRVTGTDAAVAELNVPGVVREGEAVTVTATVEATVTAPAVVALLRDGAQVAEQAVDLEAGPNEVAFEDVATGSGVTRYQVRVRYPGDTIAENDIGFAAAVVEGPATVLLLEGRPGNGRTLTTALEAAAIPVDVLGIDAVPPVDELAGYASIVLVDVDARTIAPEHVEALTAATRDLGRGLVTIGGTQSFGLGGYLGSDLEALLPVVSEILDPLRRQPVAEVLAIDTSGSMGACHCAEGANGVLGGNSLEGGINKTDISRAGAARAIAALSDIDEVGVLAVNTSERWAIDLQQLPPEDVVTSGLRTLVPSENGTDLSRTLSTAAEALRASEASLKHIILFTDGFTATENLLGMADEAAALLDEGITVSVVATGEGAARELAAIATAGGGRFYPGRDLQQIPQILAEEAQLASRDFVQEGRFLPEVTSAAAPVAGLTATPPLLGYIATTAKPTATTHLRLGPELDPLLASWQVGLGRSTAWTSDLDRWGQTWATWDGFVSFWSATVRDTFPVGGDAGTVRSTVDGDTLSVVVEGADAFPDGATATARVALPDGTAAEIALTRSAGNVFTGNVPVTGAGTYAVGASVTAEGSTLVAGTALASRSYSEEYEPGAPDEALLARLSAATGGRGAITAAQAFDAAELDVGRTRHPVTTWLLLAAALLFPLAVAVSRLALRATPALARARYLGATAGWRVSQVARRVRPPSRAPGRDRDRSPPPPRPEAPLPPPPPVPAPPPGPSSTLDSLLDSRRRRRDGDG